jgi:hypothetical protein
MPLVHTLGEGRHFGEWWGCGINRSYGKQRGQKFFSLFNTKRWTHHPDRLAEPIPELNTVPNLTVVPTIFEGPFLENSVSPPWIRALAYLREYGSLAAPGYDRPEGIVLYHKAANMLFKVTLENDESPKELFFARGGFGNGDG